MKRVIHTRAMLFMIAAIISATGCKKDATEPNEAVPTTSLQVMSDFAANVAISNYSDIAGRAMLMNEAVRALDSHTTDSNLIVAQNAWRSTRSAWELCEGFLFGPVEDYNYDPTMDDWPVNRVDLDSLLASTNPLAESDVNALPTSLKGFHPIEYVLFGSGGTRRAAQLTPREKLYLVSLCANIKTTTEALRDSWDTQKPGNFTAEFLAAGTGSGRYATRKDALAALVTSMAGICDEVANGKMADPFLAQDSTLEESQFSHNSTIDFRNNLTGVRNAYLGKYTADGRGLNDLVSAKNAALDNTLQTQMTVAIQSLEAIDNHFGKAIYTQQAQIRAAQTAINILQSTIENDLLAFINANVRD